MTSCYVRRLRGGLPLLAFLALAALPGAVACDDDTTGDSITPVTGIVVQAETVTNGKGCGLGVGQVYKYAVAAAEHTSHRVVGGDVYDCFTDGTFLNLPADDNGAFDFDLYVFAYDAAAYDAAGDANIAGAARGATPVPSLSSTLPTWTTSCHASQLDQATALAVCTPLALGLAGVDPTLAGADAASQSASVVVYTTTFARAADAGGTLTCGVDFTTVRHAEVVGGVASAPTDVACTDKITIASAQAPAAYTIEVALLDPGGNLVGQTTCSATTAPGATAAAVCKPVP